LCTVAGAGLTLAQVSRRRTVAKLIPVKNSDDDICLPSEFKMKEARAYVEEEPVTTEQE
jgi:hypothetical protein